MNYLPSDGAPGHESGSGSAQDANVAETGKNILTEEQLRVVRHPLGRHARVLAVAGSGKTTTMAHRVEHLIREQGVPTSGVLVVMFNKLARIQFRDKLAQMGMDGQRQPPVHTFHSVAYRIINDAVAKAFLPAFTNNWIEDRAEQARYAVHRAIRNLESRKIAHPDSIDPEEALDAIALWKGALIPPERAGYHGKMKLPAVYAEYERLRTQAHALTFDDFVPLALGILEAEAELRQRWCNRVSAMIVDEYQDVNHGQQRLLEMLAGTKADVMVVGDEDQTIYEWRGARPSYILQEFERTFDNKPHDLYQLPHTFRFGPVLAQCAQNVIERNVSRIEKPLIAHAVERGADIHVFKATSWQQTDPHLSLAEQVKALVRETNDPSNIIVLGRTYAQLNELEAVFLSLKIPYRVVGRKPFFERREIQVLLDYVKMAMRLTEPVSRQTQNLLLSVANTPNRKLARNALTRAIASAHQRKESTRDALEFLADSPMSPMSKLQREAATDLLQVLERIREKIEKGDAPADDFLNWLVQMLDYLKHFDDYYGQGEHSEERKQAVLTFCRFAEKSKMSIRSLISLVDKLDTTQGAPEEHQIVMTSVFRTKGLEYDYVIIPNCIEGFMPCMLGSDNLTYDKAGLVNEPEASARIESERRLFYVALTRARKTVFIGTTSISAPARDQERQPVASCFLGEMTL
ncbi:MAG: ATP-dependent helicase, partial [Desulfovibrionales bacterium]